MAADTGNRTDTMGEKVKWPREFPGVHWLGAEEEAAVLDVLRSRTVFRYYGMGTPKYVSAFEDIACEYYGVRYALAVNSGTGALITAMTALGIGPGSEVIVPCFMWAATINAVVQMRAIPVLCEVDESFTMDPDDLERKLTPRTRLIVAVHMAGVPCDVVALMNIADRHDVPVLEDCAQANGGEFRGRKLGTFGKMGMFSLQTNKNITSGEGGLVITGDERLYERAVSAHDLGVAWVNGAPADPKPYALMWGGGRRMSELCGAVASVQMRKLPNVLQHMRASKGHIKALLQGTPGLAFRRLHDEDGDTGPFLILLMETEKQAVTAAEMMKSAGLDNVCRLADYGLHVYYNISALVKKVGVTPAGDPWTLVENRESRYEYGKGTCPSSDALFERSILVPVPSCLTAEQEEFAAHTIRSALGASTA